MSLYSLLFGIIFLMTAKPQLTVAIGAMVVSVLLGLLSSFPHLRLRGAPPSGRFHQHEEDGA